MVYEFSANFVLTNIIIKIETEKIYVKEVEEKQMLILVEFVKQEIELNKL